MDLTWDCLKKLQFCVNGSSLAVLPQPECRWHSSNPRETEARLSPVLKGCQILVVSQPYCFQFPLFLCNLVLQRLQGLALMPTVVCRILNQSIE
jgi:hypothetical protein